MKPTSSSNTTNTNPTILSPQIISTKSSSISNSNNKNTATSDVHEEQQPLEHLIRGNNSDSTESRCESIIIVNDDDNDDSSLILYSDSTTEAGDDERRERVEENQQQLHEREMPAIETSDSITTTATESQGPLSPDTPRFAAFMDFITSGGGDDDNETAEEQQQQQGATNADEMTNNQEEEDMSATTDNDNIKAMEDMSLTTKEPPTHHPNPSHSSSQHTPYNPTSYKYHNRYTTLSSSNYTTASNTRTKIGKRCYRLNLERPFDIHCEQSPLVRFVIYTLFVYNTCLFVICFCKKVCWCVLYCVCSI